MSELLLPCDFSLSFFFFFRARETAKRKLEILEQARCEARRFRSRFKTIRGDCIASHPIFFFDVRERNHQLGN